MVTCNIETAGDIAERIIDKIESHDGIAGYDMAVKTGYNEIDAASGDFNPGELIVIAGRVAMGKTALALNMARKMALTDGVGVGFISLELVKEEVVKKLLAIDSGVDSVHIRTAELSDVETKSLRESKDRLVNSKLFISDRVAPSVDELSEECNVMVKKHGVKAIFIDYAQLINGDGAAESREDEVSDILRGLKETAAELNVPVIVLSQVSRTTDLRADHRPCITDFRFKEAYEEYADMIMYLYRDEYYNRNSDMKGIAEITVTKHNAKVGTAKLLWDPALYLFY